jgi:hypothetical protein
VHPASSIEWPMDARRLERRGGRITAMAVHATITRQARRVIIGSALWANVWVENQIIAYCVGSVYILAEGVSVKLYWKSTTFSDV